MRRDAAVRGHSAEDQGSAVGLCGLIEGGMGSMGRGVQQQIEAPGRPEKEGQHSHGLPSRTGARRGVKGKGRGKGHATQRVWHRSACWGSAEATEVHSSSHSPPPPP